MELDKNIIHQRLIHRNFYKSKEEMIEILEGIETDELIADEGVSLLVSNQKVKRILE